MMGSTLKIRISGIAEPAYTAYELFQPSRIIVDMAGTAIDEQGNLQLPDNLPVSLVTSEIADSAQALTRFEFIPDGEYTEYNVSVADNSIILTLSLINETAAGEDASPEGEGPEGEGSDAIGSLTVSYTHLTLPTKRIV